MKPSIRAALACLYLSLYFGANSAKAVTFDWATIGNPGNVDDVTGYGGVNYAYRISKYEVTNSQYAEFLNAVDPSGTNSLSLYNLQMLTDARGGISRNIIVPDGAKYQIKSGRENNPVVFVSFFDAMRFVNWLHNGQGSGDTETGVYTIGSGLDETRSPNARYFIPSEDEWYKAAYHKNDGVTGNYWRYPTGTDRRPYSDNPGSLNTPDNTNVGNFFNTDLVDNGYDDGFAVTGSIGYVDSQNYLTDVGAYDLATSPYGTFDQIGNVWEWNEAVKDSRFRGGRGGSWEELSSSFSWLGMRPDGDYVGDGGDFGFRVASIIPEPSTLLLLMLASPILTMRRQR